MIRQAILEANKPKDFWIYRKRAGSRKWEFSANKKEKGGDGYGGYHITLDTDNYSILKNGDFLANLYDPPGGNGGWVVDWDNAFGPDDFGAKAWKRIKSMLDYMKEM